MTTRQANLVRSRRRCLKCGRPMWTDRCHRVCVACSHRNEGLLDDRARVPQELRPLVRGLVVGDIHSVWAMPSVGLPALVED